MCGISHDCVIHPPRCNTIMRKIPFFVTSAQAVVSHKFFRWTLPAERQYGCICDRKQCRCYIWKQWKKPRKRAKSLIQLGIPEWQAWAVSNCRKAYWHMAKNGHVQRAISTEKLAQRGYKSILELYERALMRLNRRIPNGTYDGVRGRLGI